MTTGNEPDEDAPAFSVIAGERRAVSTKSPESLTLMFVGDLMFDRLIRARARAHGYRHVLADVAPLLRKGDVVVGNLEGPITSEPSVSVGTVPGDPGNLTFTFPPQVATLLRESGFSVVSVGNNHALDFGQAGLVETRAHLESAGLAYIGDPADPFAGYVRPSGDGMLRIYAYNEFGGASADALAEHIAQYAPDDYIVVYAHWGAEYVEEPPAYVRATARQFVDAGADLVVGAHPHVIQPSETYRGARIYYSLGNFVFDQYWDASVRTGLVVSVTLGETPQFEEHRVYLASDGATRLVGGE